MTHIVAVDYDSGRALFQARDSIAVIVDIHKRDVVRMCSMPRAMTASAWMKVARDMNYPTVWRELADAAVTSLEVQETPAEPKVERKFRVPQSVKEECQQAIDWSNAFERGGTAPSLAVARKLIRETYITLSDVQRLARYFARRSASITENTGWAPGTEGFPTDDRIKYSLWGGLAAREWVAKIDKKHPLIAAAPSFDGVPVDGAAAPATDGDGDIDPNAPHEYVEDPDVPGQCLICGREQSDDIHAGAVVGGGFEYDGTCDYFGKGIDPDSTQVDDLYIRRPDGTWAHRVQNNWEDIDEPGEDEILIMLDEDSAYRLADILDDIAPTDPTVLPYELSLLNPTEAALFRAADAEIDWEFIDRVFDIYDSQERSVNAKKQVRGPGGKFGDQPDNPDAKKTAPQATKARLPQALPIVPNVAQRIDQYLADVGKKRGATPATPSADDTGGPTTASIEEDPEAEFNWVDDVGGLPKYIKRIEKHLREKGMTEGHAIATAVNVVKKMCATGDINFPGKQQVNVGSQAEACAAVAEWEEKKARAKANSSLTEFADGGPAAVTDVRPLYLAIVDSVDTEAVLDVISLVPPVAGAAGDVTAWKRDNGTWVQAPELLAGLRGVTPPPVVELTDDTVLQNVLEQVDKSTADTSEPDEQLPGAPTPTPNEAPNPAVNPDQNGKPAEPVTAGAEFGDKSSEKRDKLSKKGYALPDGSYPIESVPDLKNAVQAFGRAKNKTLARQHIIKRARALNRTDLLPKDWDFSERETGYSMWGPHGEIISLVAAEGGADQNRGNAEKLRHYWVRGEGAAKIGWNTPGDWYRCVSHLSKYLGSRAKGYCTLRHKDATGFWPGEEENH